MSADYTALQQFSLSTRHFPHGDHYRYQKESNHHDGCPVRNMQADLAAHKLQPVTTRKEEKTDCKRVDCRNQYRSGCYVLGEFRQGVIGLRNKIHYGLDSRIEHFRRQHQADGKKQNDHFLTVQFEYKADNQHQNQR